VLIIAVTHFRRRYIAFKIHSENDVSFHRLQIIKAIQDTCMKSHHTSCKTFDFFLTRFQHNTGILRCFHKEKNRAIALLQSIKFIEDTAITIETIATSGTIKSLIKKHLNGDQLQDSKD